MRHIALQRYSLVYLFGLFSLFTVVTLCLADIGSVERLSREGGPLENLTVVLYTAVIVILLLDRGGGENLRRHSAFVVLLLLLRELDMHNALTADNILKFSYYVDSQATAMEKLGAGAVVLACAYVVIRYSANIHLLLHALRARRGYAYTILAALAMLPLTKIIDSAPRVLRKDFGVAVSDDLAISARLFEESFELAIPIMLLWACFQFQSYRNLAGRQNVAV